MKTQFLKSLIMISGTLVCIALLPSIHITASGNEIFKQRTEEIKDSLNLIMDEAKKGDPEAMNEVGTWYYIGKHVNRDYNQAYEWWKNAALKSNIRAIANLGLCYQLGRGVEKDSIAAIRLYKKSVKEGNNSLLTQRSENAEKNAFDAMLVGDCYENGVGVIRDYAKAAKFYSLAAAKGSIDGMRKAGLCYMNVKENNQALQLFKQGAALGDLSCQYWTGKLLLEGMGIQPNKEQGVVYILKAAEGGMASAQTEMGILYETGNGVTQNLQQAMEWYHKSAKQGNARGMWNFGMALKDGRGIDKDYDQALFWLSEATPIGYKRAFKNLISQLDSVRNDSFLNYVRGMKLYLIDGNKEEASAQFKKVAKANIDEGVIMQAVILADKTNVKPNAKKAAKMLEKLASRNAEAAYYLGMLYEAGNGVEQDIRRAIDLFQESADMDYGKAQCYLADIYYEGRGVDKNLIKAVSLYLGAKDNHQLSLNGAIRLAECYENGLAGLSIDKVIAEQLRSHKSQDNIIASIKEIDF